MKNISFKYCLVTTLFALLPTLLFAQAPDTLWTKKYGGAQFDAGEAVQPLYEGGYIICGYTESFGEGGSDFYLLKTDSLGDTLWTKTYGGSKDDTGWWVEETVDSGYIVVGETKSFSDGNADVWLIKTDADGDTTWTKTYGGADTDWGKSVQINIEGGYIICGASSSFNPGQDLDVYLIKTDDQGDTIWTKTYGGDDDDEGYSVQQTADSGYIIAGGTRSFGPGDWDVYLIKTDSLGDTLWTKVHGKSYDDRARSVEQTVNGGYIVTGYTALSDTGDWNVWLLKINATGDTAWVEDYGGTDDEEAGGVHQTSDGGYIIAGYSGSFETPDDAVYVIKTDSLGNILWTKNIGGITSEDHATSLQIVSDGGYIITGYSLGILSSGDVYLIRLAKPQGVEEEITRPINYYYGATIFSGPLILPADKKCRVYDITGRTIDATNLAPGIYFVEIEGQITNKIIKIR